MSVPAKGKVKQKDTPLFFYFCSLISLSHQAVFTEIPVLESLITIRHKLSALKKDRDLYIDPNVIIELFKETEKQVEKLNDLRTGDIWSSSSRNRLNDVLDDVMALLSLFFMSIGRNRESNVDKKRNQEESDIKLDSI